MSFSRFYRFLSFILSFSLVPLLVFSRSSLSFVCSDSFSQVGDLLVALKLVCVAFFFRFVSRSVCGRSGFRILSYSMYSLASSSHWSSLLDPPSPFSLFLPIPSLRCHHVPCFVRLLFLKFVCAMKWVKKSNYLVNIFILIVFFISFLLRFSSSLS